MIAGMLGAKAPTVFVRDLSWAGHDFIAVLQGDSVWSQIKQQLSAAEIAGMPLEVLKDVGVGMPKEYAQGRLGLSGD